MSSNYSTFFQNHANQGNLSYKIFYCNQTNYNLQNVWMTFNLVGRLYRRTSIFPTFWQDLGHNVFQLDMSFSGTANNNFSYNTQFYQQDFNKGISNVPRTANIGDGGFLARNFVSNINGGFYYSTYPSFHLDNDVLGINIFSITTPTINVLTSNQDNGRTEYTYGHIYIFSDTDLLQDPNEDEEDSSGEENEIEIIMTTTPFSKKIIATNCLI